MQLEGIEKVRVSVKEMEDEIAPMLKNGISDAEAGAIRREIERTKVRYGLLPPPEK